MEVRYENKSYKGFSITSLVVGIVSVIFTLTIWIPLIGGIVAVVFGAIARKNGDGSYRSYATAGFVLGIIALAGVVLIILFLILFVGLIDYLLQNQDYYY